MHARSLILSLVLTLPAASLAAQQPADTTPVPRTIAAATDRITLADAVTRAVQVQPATVQARGAVRSADAQQRSAYGAFLPNVNATSSASSSTFQGRLVISVIGPPGRWRASRPCRRGR